MSKVKFTEEQQKELRNNKYTARVTANSLSFTKEFKELFYQEYQMGSIPRDILREHGYPAEWLGKRRIWGITHCIKTIKGGDVTSFTDTNLKEGVTYIYWIKSYRMDYQNKKIYSRSNDYFRSTVY